MEAEAEAVEVEAEAVEAEAEGEPQRAAQRPEEEETRNSLERNHPHSMGIAKMLTDSCRIFKDICH